MLDENIVRAVVNAVDIHSSRQGSRHRSTHARPPENVKIGPNLSECLIDPEVGAPERAAATSNETDRPTGQETVEPFNVRGILNGDVMMHGHVAFTEPRKRAFGNVGTC